MTTTIILLLLVLIVELARLVLQYRSWKTFAESKENTYCKAYEVEHKTATVINEHDMRTTLDVWGRRGYGLVAVVLSGHNYKDDCNIYTLFLTKKKIKNFKED